VRPSASGLIALTLALPLVAGCRGTWEQRIAPAQQAFYEGQEEDAAELLRKQLEDGLHGPDELLLRMEYAMALQAAGRYADATRQLMAADDRLELLDYTRAPIDALTSALFSVDRRDYRATRPERLMLNVQNMINFLGAGDWEGAAVEARRARVQLLQTDVPEDRKYSSRLVWGLAGVCFELAGRDGESADAYRTAQVPGLDVRPAAGEGSILVVVQNGKAPVRRQARYLLLVHDRLHRLQVPALVPRAGGAARALVSVDGLTVGEAPVLLDLSAQAAHRYDLEFPRLLAAAALAVVPRQYVGEAVVERTRDEDEPDQSSRNVLAQLLGFLATEAVAEALPADTRCWSLLPADIRALRVNVPAGTHRVTVTMQAGTGAASRSLEWEVSVQDGGFALVDAVGATLEGWAAAPEPRLLDATHTPAGVAALELLEAALVVREAWRHRP
jgi:hypothetical protein